MHDQMIFQLSGTVNVGVFFVPFPVNDCTVCHVAGACVACAVVACGTGALLVVVGALLVVGVVGVCVLL